MDIEVLNGLFRPKSIAVIGASSTPGKIGYTVVENLVKDNYKGQVYPINPKADEILGLKVYKSVLDVPGTIDAAVVTVPAKFVMQALEECGQKGVKGFILITSGFAEVGAKDVEEKLVEVAHSYNMRILGPNIVGTISNQDSMNASFCPILAFQRLGSFGIPEWCSGYCPGCCNLLSPSWF